MTEPPARDELELTVFGRGYGECILIHVGDAEWVCVDSFRGSDGRPVAETYLAQLEGEHELKALVLTHWDDDHTKGAAELIEAFELAEVWIPAVFNNDEAFEYAYAHTDAERDRKVRLGLREFVLVADALADRPGLTRYSMPGRRVLEDYDTQIRIMSPHDEIVKRGFAALGITTRPGYKGITSPEPNDTCSVLWIERDDGNALLGADLEESRWGWKEIVKRPAPTGQAAEFIKVPHHGSPDAHSEVAYRQLCADRVWAAVTRYTPGSTPRPSVDDQARLRELVGEGWILGAVGADGDGAEEVQDYEDFQLVSISTWRLDGDVGFVQVRYSGSAGEWIARAVGSVEAL